MRKLVGRDKDSLIREGKRKKSDTEAITLYLPQASQCTVNAQAMTILEATPHLPPLFHLFIAKHLCHTQKLISLGIFVSKCPEGLLKTWITRSQME